MSSDERPEEWLCCLLFDVLWRSGYRLDTYDIDPHPNLLVEAGDGRQHTLSVRECAVFLDDDDDPVTPTGCDLNNPAFYEQLADMLAPLFPDLLPVGDWAPKSDKSQEQDKTQQPQEDS